MLLATFLGLLLATPLLLTTLRHTISYPARALRRQPEALRLRYNVFSYTRGTRKLDMVPFDAHPRARKCREPAAGDRVTRPSRDRISAVRPFDSSFAGGRSALQAVVGDEYTQEAKGARKPR